MLFLIFAEFVVGTTRCILLFDMLVGQGKNHQELKMKIFGVPKKFTSLHFILRQEKRCLLLVECQLRFHATWLLLDVWWHFTSKGNKLHCCIILLTLTPGNFTCYSRTVPQVLLWQWINQSFNAIVNYTNRSGDSHITNE
jgi:hypothetical protein